MNPLQKFSPPILAALVLLVLVGGGILTLSQIQKQQNNQSNAQSVQWNVTQSASASCIPAGTVNIAVTFTNEESSAGINVKAKDNQTGNTVNLGTVKAHATATGQIATGRQTLNSGQVTFTMTWASGQSGSDTRTASYNAVKQCVSPSPTLTPIPTATKTPTPTLPVSPTPTVCPTPGTVKNIKIICPYCSPTPGP